jgi:hypothetical protein
MGVVGPQPWSAAAIAAFVLSILGFLGFTAILGIILGIVGIIVTSGGRRRGMGLAISAIPISLVTGAVSAFIVIGIVFFARGAEFIKKIEPVFSASTSSMHDAASKLHELGSKDFQEAVSTRQIEEWLREIGKEHGKLTALKLDQTNPIAKNPSGEAVLNIDGKFVNGPATIRLTFTKENIWTPRIEDIEVSGSSPRASPDNEP